MRFGIVSMPLAGHLNPMVALARKLLARGHEISFFGLPDAGSTVASAGLSFVPFGEQQFPLGATPAAYARLATLMGDDVTRYSAHHLHPLRCQVALDQLPRKFKEQRIQAVLIDTTHHYVELAAIAAGLPYIHICNILPFDATGTTPPFTVDWRPDSTEAAVARNLEEVRKSGSIFAPVRQVAREWASRNKLNIDWTMENPTSSPLAVITQVPLEFDFAMTNWPIPLHYTGPFYDFDARKPCFFSWERLTGEPIVYASMGTLVNGLESAFSSIVMAARSCTGTQLVLSTGSNIRPESLSNIPKNAIVVQEAPQPALLSHSALCVTHAGINTVLESLGAGVPMVAIPVGFDQPGNAARVKHHGAGEHIPVAALTGSRLGSKMAQVLSEPCYRNRAAYFRDVLKKRDGTGLAADIIEKALYLL